MVWQAILGKVLGNAGKGPEEMPFQMQQYDAPEGTVEAEMPRAEPRNLASSVMEGMQQEPLPQQKRRYY